MKITRHAIAAIVALCTTAATLLAVGAQEAHASVTSLYMAPGGCTWSTTNTTCGNASTPAGSLASIQARLKSDNPATDVEIRIHPGTYSAGNTRWSYYIDGHSISFMPVDFTVGEDETGIASRPIFDGTGQSGAATLPWFSARVDSGDPGGNKNLRFYYLQVQNYGPAGIGLSGGTATVDVDSNGNKRVLPTSAGVNGNIIEGMLFRSMGNKHVTNGNGYGAINTDNSSNNIIRHNRFEFLENSVSGTVNNVHGVYFAHHSSGNQVYDNEFYNISGDPAHVRNDSNGNNFYNNTFELTGSVAFYSDWHSANRECYSHGNLFHDNNLISGYKGATVKETHLPTYAEAVTCSNPNSEPRVTTYNNT